jgi:hypothetical protein
MSLSSLVAARCVDREEVVVVVVVVVIPKGELDPEFIDKNQTIIN